MLRVGVGDGKADAVEVTETRADSVGRAEPVVVRDTLMERVARGVDVPVTVSKAELELVSEGEAVVEALIDDDDVSDGEPVRVGAPLTLREGDHDSDGEPVGVREAEGEPEAEDVAEDESEARTVITVLLAVALGVRVDVFERVGRLVMSVRVGVPETEVVRVLVGRAEREAVGVPVCEGEPVEEGEDDHLAVALAPRPHAHELLDEARRHVVEGVRLDADGLAQ